MISEHKTVPPQVCYHCGSFNAKLLNEEDGKMLIEKIKDNFNQRYEFRNKQHTLENIMFENIREFSRYIMGNVKQLEFTIPDIEIKRNDNS